MIQVSEWMLYIYHTESKTYVAEAVRLGYDAKWAEAHVRKKYASYLRDPMYSVLLQQSHEIVMTGDMVEYAPKERLDVCDKTQTSQ